MLLDADGVVQRSTTLGGEIDALTGHLGEGTTEWLTQTFPPDGPVLCGRAEVVPLLAEALLANGSDADAQRLYDDLWLAIEVSPESLAVARRASCLRGGSAPGHEPGPPPGGVHEGRARVRRRLRLRFYSCDVGWAKPSAEFFTHIVETLDVSADQVLFVDDSQANVDGARNAGLRAERWELDDGIDALETLLTGHGLTMT